MVQVLSRLFSLIAHHMETVDKFYCIDSVFPNRTDILCLLCT